jgi:hypothetical protein
VPDGDDEPLADEQEDVPGLDDLRPFVQLGVLHVAGGAQHDLGVVAEPFDPRPGRLRGRLLDGRFVQAEHVGDPAELVGAGSCRPSQTKARELRSAFATASVNGSTPGSRTPST